MSQNIGKVALNFMFIRDQLKIYHWSTKNYARHKSSDDFFDNLTTKMDKFIETMSGIEGVHISIPKGASGKFNFKNETDKSIVKLLKDFREWLINSLPKYLKKNTDLLNIRDDILSDVNNTLYLFTIS